MSRYAESRAAMQYGLLVTGSGRIYGVTHLWSQTSIHHNYLFLLGYLNKNAPSYLQNVTNKIRSV